jgi:hypothetical protein
LKRHTLIGCFACVLSMTTWAHAQATPTASRVVGTIAVGTGWSILNPDFAQSHIGAITFWGDMNLPYSLGVEGVIHYSVNTPSDVSENSYVIGPRYIVHPHKRVELYAKALFGVGHFGLQQGSFANPNTATYFEYQVGGGIDVRVTRHIKIRAIDFEAQKWPGFHPNTLSPWGGTVGVSYVFH